MVDIGKTLDVSDRAEWRRWLQENHASETEVWLVYHSKASGKPSLAYNDAVDEALCFGWIDSTVKKLGPDSRAQRFTPRRPGSPVSAMNKERIRRLREARLMTEAGLKAAGDLAEAALTIAEDILAAIKADEETWRHFAAFPDTYKRIRLAFIEAARNRPEMFQRRLAYFLKMTKQGKRFGMVQ